MNEVEKERKGRENGRRKERRKEERRRGVDSFHREGKIDGEGAAWLCAKAGKCSDPTERCSVNQQSFPQNPTFSSAPQSTGSVPQCISLPLKRFFSLPRLNRRQLNTQMYSSSLSCWKGNIFENMTTRYHSSEKLEEERKGYKGGLKQNF